MKTIEMLTNVDKARVIFDLFREEMPEMINYLQIIANRVIDEEEQLKATWDNPFVSYHQWKTLANQVIFLIKKYGKTLAKSGSVFSDQLFSGYTAIFTNHCVEQYGTYKARSLRFKQAVALFYLPVGEIQKDNNYIVLELHGGPEYAAIVTDESGNNRVFDNRPDAEAEAGDCQDGLIVEI